MTVNGEKALLAERKYEITGAKETACPGREKRKGVSRERKRERERERKEFLGREEVGRKACQPTAENKLECRRRRVRRDDPRGRGWVRR